MGGRHRIAYIDGLRAVAVLLVVAYHAADRQMPRYTFPGNVLVHGGHGVELFFVLSGFCLSYPTLARLHEDRAVAFDVARYAAHRIVRIVPPYWAAIVCLTLLALFLAGHGWPVPAGFTLLDAAKQALFLNVGQHLLTRPFWSLPVEFRWYFVFPIVLWLWTKSPKAFTAVGCAAVVLSATSGQSMDAYCLPAFMLGIVAAEIRLRQLRVGMVSGVAFVLVASTAMIVSHPAPDAGGWYEGWGVQWYLAAFALVVAAGSVPAIEAILSWRILAFIGLCSYSIYLVHAPVIEWMQVRHAGVLVPAILGIAAGIGFWYVAERPFVSGRARNVLIAEFQSIFRARLPQIGVSATFNIEATSAAIAASPKLSNNAAPELKGSEV